MKQSLTFFTLLLISSICYGLPNKLYKVDKSAIKTTPTVDYALTNTDFGSCRCDLTAGACDAYCCCDQDCGAEILEQWKADDSEVCTKNYIN